MNDSEKKSPATQINSQKIPNPLPQNLLNMPEAINSGAKMAATHGSVAAPEKTAASGISTATPKANSTGAATGTGEVIMIKKYANRRLYNTASSSYVTLDNLCDMVKQDIDFAVFDARTGEDITRSVLTQIIVEEESKGQNLLPVGFLRHLISFYGNSMQWLVPTYLEGSITAFSKNQGEMQQYFSDAFGGIFNFGPIEQMTRQNMAIVEQAMKVFNPFNQNYGVNGMKIADAAKTPPVAATGTTTAATAATQEGLDAMKQQLEALQKQVDQLNRSGRS